MNSKKMYALIIKVNYIIISNVTAFLQADVNRMFGCNAVFVILYRFKEWLPSNVDEQI